jgi:hypothetical protein
MTPQHPLQDGVLAGHRRDIAPSLGCGELRPLGQECDPSHLGLHYTRVEPVNGWFYGVCSCRPRVISLAMSTAFEAIQWQCPFEHAEADVAKAWQRFEASFGR